MEDPVPYGDKGYSCLWYPSLSRVPVGFCAKQYRRQEAASACATCERGKKSAEDEIQGIKEAMMSKRPEEGWVCPSCGRKHRDGKDCGFTGVSKEVKEEPKKTGYIPLVSLDFNKYPRLYQELEEVATEEFRTVAQQILFYMHEVLVDGDEGEDVVKITEVKNGNTA
jgi:DNA repair exonuclease SbcCD ATPase subunit